MSILENYEKMENTKSVKTNIEGVKMTVHKLQYTVSPGDFWTSEARTAYIIGEDFKAAEKLIVEHMPKGKNFTIDATGDSVLDIHGITPEMKKRLYRALQKEFDPTTKKILRKKNVRRG